MLRTFDGRIEIAVCEDDVGALAAQLERDALPLLCTASVMMSLPTCVLPVNAILSTSMVLRREQHRQFRRIRERH